MEREVGGGIGMGNTCKPLAVSFQCMTKSTTNKKKKKKKKNTPAIRETWVRSLGWEDPLEKGKATHSSVSGLENSMSCIVHGVTKSPKSRTRLSDPQFLLGIALL